MPPASPYILCVDDDGDDLLFITSALRQAHPRLRTATAYIGMEALALLEEVYRAHQLHALIISDINMPRMDGKEVLAALKKRCTLCLPARRGIFHLQRRRGTPLLRPLWHETGLQALYIR